jgi:hypothetical protein
LSHEELTALINSIMKVTNVAFFGLAGASLKLVSWSAVLFVRSFDMRHDAAVVSSIGRQSTPHH